MTRLRLVSRPLHEFCDGDRNLNDIAGAAGTLFVRDGVGFAGVGEAARVALDDVPALLRDVVVDDPLGVAGSGGVVIGSHPFAGVGGTAIVPRVLVGKPSEGPHFVTFVEGGESLVREALTPREPAPTSATAYTISPGVSTQHYLAAVTAARDAVRSCRLVKAVIARDIVVEASSPIDVHALLRRLQVSFGSSYRYSIDSFVGASPELLVARDGDVVTSHPLAGTTPRTGDPAADARLASALRASEKNQIEHRVVIDMVHDTLLPHCSYLDWEPEPTVVKVANVQHLGTRLQGALSNPRLHVLDAARSEEHTSNSSHRT